MSRLWEPRDPLILSVICGPDHIHLRHLEQAFADKDFSAESQGGGVYLRGSRQAETMAERSLSIFETVLATDPGAGIAALEGAIAQARTVSQVFAPVPGLKTTIKPQTSAQARYLDLLIEPGIDLVFGVGPAGTGKTFLAVAAGVSAIKHKSAARLIITRPAVESGENLGFLPGDLEEKVDPYLRPVWDALDETLGAEQLRTMRDRKIIEIAPLAFMRGRTLRNAFIIMDEAQNASVAQMHMVLTRLGRDSRMVITGDPDQVDLPSTKPSGLNHALDLLAGIKGIGRVTFTAEDVRRHPLVSRIIRAYDADAKRTKP